MATARPVVSVQASRSDYIALIYLAAAWGGSFLFIKLAIETMGPATVAGWRIGLAGLLLAVIAKMRGMSLSFSSREWGWLLLMGVLGNSLPFTLISWGEHYVDAGLAAILMALTPLATMIMAHFFVAGDHLTRQKIYALICGSMGILVLVGVEVLTGIGDAVPAQIGIMLAACCYAGSSIAARRVAGFGRPLLATGAAALLVSWIALLPVIFLFEKPFETIPTGQALVSVLYLALFPTAIAVLLVLRIVDRAGPAFLSLNNYMVPIFGVAWGALFLGESVGWNAVLALLFIFGGIFLAGRKKEASS